MWPSLLFRHILYKKKPHVQTLVKFVLQENIRSTKFNIKKESKKKKKKKKKIDSKVWN